MKPTPIVFPENIIFNRPKEDFKKLQKINSIKFQIANFF
jgi:hypothetical protein